MCSKAVPMSDDSTHVKKNEDKHKTWKITKYFEYHGKYWINGLCGKENEAPTCYVDKGYKIPLPFPKIGDSKLFILFFLASEKTHIQKGYSDKNFCHISSVNPFNLIMNHIIIGPSNEPYFNTIGFQENDTIVLITGEKTKFTDPNVAICAHGFIPGKSQALSIYINFSNYGFDCSDGQFISFKDTSLLVKSHINKEDYLEYSLLDCFPILKHNIELSSNVHQQLLKYLLSGLEKALKECINNYNKEVMEFKYKKICNVQLKFMDNEVVQFQPSCCAWLINKNSPLMETTIYRPENDMINIDQCPKSVFSSILLIIMEQRVPSMQDLLKNDGQLIRFSNVLMHILSYLGIDFYSDFFQNVENIIKNG